MPRKIKKTGVIVDIPEMWKNEVKDKDGKIQSVTEYYLGGGRIKIFNLLDREEMAIRKKTGGWAFVPDGSGAGRQVATHDAVEFQEEIFLARTKNGNDCFWEGFEDENGKPQNCTEKNLRDWSKEVPIYLFVCHVGKLLDAEAENRATEEEKNSLNSFVRQPDAANESTKAGAKNAGKAGRKE